MKRMACVLALAAGTSLAGAVQPQSAMAEPNPTTVANGLQVNIISPGTVSEDSSITLNAKFNGGNIRLLELFIDGDRVAKQSLNTKDRFGALHFTLDANMLAVGDHEVVVKAYEADGTTATSSTHINVTASDANALVKFAWPKRNAEVQGVVPIRLKLDDSLLNPYVTYIVDNEFLAFRNFAPYTYNWDSSKVDNGIHTITIEVMDSKTLQPMQKLKMVINVKNQGGFTHVQETTPNIGASGHSGAAANHILGIAESVLPEMASHLLQETRLLHTDADLAKSPAMRLGGIPAELISGAVSINAKPSGANIGISKSNTGRNTSTNRLPDALSPNMSRYLTGSLNIAPLEPGRSVDPGTLLSNGAPISHIGAPTNHDTANPIASAHFAPGLSAILSDPAELTPTAVPGLSRQSPKMHRQGAIAMRPEMERGTSGIRTAVVSTVKPIGTKRAAGRKTFDVAFNNSPIFFDVPPRVENGIPLAPFRAIFEYTGGKVEWFNQSKVVRATNDEHEIEIHIGKKEAKVNNKPLLMDSIPYIDNGRTIVPLSFIKDAMNVKVKFDEATGHLLIESNK